SIPYGWVSDRISTTFIAQIGGIRIGSWFSTSPISFRVVPMNAQPSQECPTCCHLGVGVPDHSVSACRVRVTGILYCSESLHRLTSLSAVPRYSRYRLLQVVSLDRVLAGLSRQCLG